MPDQDRQVRELQQQGVDVVGERAVLGGGHAVEYAKLSQQPLFGTIAFLSRHEAIMRVGRQKLNPTVSFQER